MSTPKPETGIAIVGMAGRFAKARNLEQFWRNLREGVESISFFTDEELEAAGVQVPKDAANFIKARAVLEDADKFDAAYFGINPREAAVTDPQHRLFLECAVEALEDAGCDPTRFPGPIGVFAGTAMNTYLARNLLGHPEMLAQMGEHQVFIGNDKDFLPTRVSYKLDLRGPSLNIQTACSTSLVAVCVACQSLLNYECDAALAGAVTVAFPQKRGYFHQEGAIFSPDGHCRAFDAKAAGAVAGEGVGIVVLKRLEDALADGDSIYAVIKGFAVNNDGGKKAGYTAPSVEGQAEVIATAQAMAGFAPATISYVEAHGTGTPLGDPIEIEGLTKAFRDGTEECGFCAIGSVKPNIGHLDVAAGVAGLIKTALSLQHRQIPPTLHFEAPNPRIDFENSPFVVNARLTEWRRDGTPRRAGVSSFGIGGTNAHVVLEEAPVAEAQGKARRSQLLILSAKTRAALDQMTSNLAAHLRKQPDLHLGSVAAALQLGRQQFNHRRVVVARDAGDAADALETLEVRRVVTGMAQETPSVAFMFPGQGAQHVNMGRGLYEQEPAFRETVDRCCELLKSELGLDLRTILYPADATQWETAQQRLTQTSLTQPALFVMEYATAKLWMSWGIQPAAMIGHSIGEYVAACLADVFSLQESLRLVAARGRMMQSMAPGVMLAIRSSEKELQPLPDERLSFAAINAPALTVVSGPAEAVHACQRSLEERGISCTLLQTSHAFHSAMMEPIVQPFAQLVATLKPRAPKLPFISNVTGTWITPEEAMSPEYWAKHLRQMVRFADGLGELAKQAGLVYLEAGPGQTLSNLAKQHPAIGTQAPVLASMRHVKDDSDDLDVLLGTLGRLWLAGVTVDWVKFREQDAGSRVHLPAYPFERKRHFVEPASAQMASVPVAVSPIEVEGKGTPEVPAPVVSAPQREIKTPTTRKERLEEQLKEIFGELSGLDLAETGSQGTFTELGFDSLFLTQASATIQKRLGVKVAFRQLLKEFPAFDALAAHIDATLPTDKGEIKPVASESPSVVEPPVSNPEKEIKLLPLTEAQKELWFASQMSDAAACAFIESRLLHLRGPLQVVALQESVRRLVARHEGLRATFPDGGELQQIHPTRELAVPLVDLSGLTPDERGARVDALLREDASRPFDLIKGPLFRAQLISLGREDHVLLLSVHHIVSDGWSLGILLQELSKFYSAACSGMSCELPPAMQLSEYAQWQKRSEGSAEYRAAEEYWVRRYADLPPSLDLPADHPRPATWTFKGGRERLEMSPELHRRLKQAAASQGCTLFTLLLAGCSTWLHRLTGQDDLVIGVPVAARSLAGADSVVSHCVQFLPVRLQVDRKQAFDRYLAAVQQNFLDAYEHQQFPFGSLIQKLNLERDPGRMPLASVTFNFDRERETWQFQGLETELGLNPWTFTNFDLGLNIAEEPDGVVVDCRYNSALFDGPTIQRRLKNFETLLEGLVNNISAPLGDLPLLPEAEERQVVVEWNQNAIHFPHHRCIHELIELQVAETSDATALIAGEERLTYKELNQRANQMAHHLRRLGVGPDVLVGVCTERTAGMIAALLGILKAGGAYVPLDPAYPAERLAFMAEDAALRVLITQESLRGEIKVDENACKILCLDSDAAAIAKESSENILSAARSSNLAYVIYTSGSTGRPKGVAIEHRSTVTLIHWADGVYSPQELAGVLASTSVCFDLSVFEFFVPLSCGGTVILADNALTLPTLPARNEVTLINTVPSAIAELVRMQGIPSSVRTINLAGEPLSIPLVQQLCRLPSAPRVCDLYGPTEDTTYSTFTERFPEGPATIGRPIANTQIYILDASQRPVPIGVPGELCIAGAGLARGYLGRPDLTAQKFVPNPFVTASFARMYHTGDLARFLPDGRIEFLGRLDHQVKIRGHRVEPGEVEAVLVRHEAVRECVVVPHEFAPGDKRLVAYLVTEPDKAATTVAELRRYLASKLPDHLVPSVIMHLEAMPLTPSGKINRRALPAPEIQPPSSEDSPQTPRTPVEEKIAEIWRDVLHVQSFGMKDRFFELGGHSLLMTRVISRIREAFQVELPLRKFFETPTVEGLAAAVEETLVEEISEMSEDEAVRFAQQTT